jgi:hypothetical protein
MNTNSNTTRRAFLKDDLEEPFDQPATLEEARTFLVKIGVPPQFLEAALQRHMRGALFPCDVENWKDQAQLDRVMSEGVDTYGQDYADKAAAAIKEQIKDLDAGLAQIYGDRPRPISPPKPTTTTTDGVSIADFPVTKPTTAGGAKSLDDYQKAVEATNKQTAAINAESAAMARLNPLVNDYGFAIAKATKSAELLTAAREAGKKVDAALARDIENTATAYAAATAAAAKLAEQQQKVREAVENMKTDTASFITGYRQDVMAGVSATEALRNSVNRLMDTILTRMETSFVDNVLFGGTTTAATGGLFGGLAKLLSFDGGGYTGMGSRSGGIDGKGGFLSVLHPKETVIDHTRPTLPRLAGRGGVGSMDVHVTVGVSADSHGNLMPFVESVTQRNINAAAPKIVSAANAGVVPTMARYQTQKAGGDWRNGT